MGGKPITSPSCNRTTRVYPRVGGETAWELLGKRLGMGLSPRGRGNPGRASVARPGDGSIPAWAGKPRRREWCARATTVYPRVGGETYAVPLVASGVAARVYPRVGGETSAGVIRVSAINGRVYPRVGGETSEQVPAPSDFAKPQVYPRVGGETFREVVGSITLVDH